MKKALILIAVFSLALHAMATASYQLDLVLTLPTSYPSMSANGGYYLVNTSTKELYAYFKGEDWKVDILEGGTYRLNTSKAYTHTAGTEITLNGVNYTPYDTYFASGESTFVPKATVNSDYVKSEFYQEFSTEVAFDKTKFGGTSTPEGYRGTNLQFLLIDEEAGLNVVIDKVYYQTDIGSGVVTFSANGTLSIPEPTSGVLALMGICCFLLKRRRQFVTSSID